MHKYAVYIGRFQPFHNGHAHVITKALALAESVVLVLGSSNGPRTIKNPWTAEEREKMIRAAMNHGYTPRLRFVAVEDAAYNDTAWATSVVDAVRAATLHSDDVVLVGHDKDSSTFYLDMFPQWPFVEVGNHGEINATEIRECLFGDGQLVMESWHADKLPISTIQFLKGFRFTPEDKQLRREWEFISEYRKSWAKAPYPPTFVTADACVIQQNHILLIQRRAEPGRGLWALPGGFVNQKERIVDAIIRELREETRLKVPDPVLRGNMKTVRVFDDPGRSLRGRTITHAALIHLPPHGDGLPEVKGDDDALDAKWWLLNDVKRSMMFEDHGDIIRALRADI